MNENITIRRTRTQPCLNENISDVSIENLDVTSSSLPDMSIGNNEQICNLLQSIEELKIQLNTAHTEIERLCLENRELQRKNENIAKKNDLLKRVANNATKPNTPSQTPQKTKKIKVDKQTQIQLTPEKIIKNTKQTQTDSGKDTKTEEDITNIKKTYFTCENESESPLDNKPKLCIISNNNRNKVLSIAEHTMENDFKLCHYLSPNKNIQQLIQSIQFKLLHFTLKDYCIILMGDEDFQEDNDRQKLVNAIRGILQVITHTNIIICIPPYQFGKYRNIINRRIQNFSKLLYLDLQKYNYAYLFDTNLYLTYDYRMFSKQTGKMNNYGLLTIFKYLSYSIISTKETTSGPYQYSANIEIKCDETNKKLFLK